MFIIVVALHIDEGRPTDLPPNHTTPLDFDKILNWDNYSDIRASLYKTVRLRVQENNSDLQNVVTRLLALPHQKSDAPNTLCFPRIIGIQYN